MFVILALKKEGRGREKKSSLTSAFLLKTSALSLKTLQKCIEFCSRISLLVKLSLLWKHFYH